MKAGKRSSLLTIENINGYNAGKYICKAENSAGWAAYATELVVNGSKLTLVRFYLLSHPTLIISPHTNGNSAKPMEAASTRMSL